MSAEIRRHGFTRRNFLFYSCTASFGLLASPVWSRKIWASSETDYYSLNAQKFMTAFEESVNAARTYLAMKYGNDAAHSICMDAAEEFKVLLPALPFIGGDAHPGTKWIVLSGQWLAFYRSMDKKGYQVRETARMMYDLYSENLKRIPADEMRKKGEMRFSEKYIEALRKRSESRTRFNELDWTNVFVPGDGVSFDYGYDYLSCPCAEYFIQQGARQLAPYFCLIDFPEHRLMGTGLMRSKTLAQGDKICDFRFKKGREVLQDWATEVPRIESVSKPRT